MDELAEHDVEGIFWSVTVNSVWALSQIIITFILVDINH